MNISNSNSIYSQVSPIANSVSGVNNNQEPVKRIEREREQSAEQQSNNTAKARFDVDEQALALVEQEYQANQKNQSNGSSQTEPNTNYDNPSDRNQSAISAYQGVENIAQKESVQQLFGVDIYA